MAPSRRLAADRGLTLQGAEGLETFLGARPASKHADNPFVCDLPAHGWESLTWAVAIPRGTISGTLEWTGNLGAVEIVTHTRWLRDQAILRCDALRSVAWLVCNNWVLRETPCRPESLSFHLEYGLGADLLSPVPGTVWPSQQYSDEPRGFRIQCISRDRPAVLTVKDLRIALKD